MDLKKIKVLIEMLGESDLSEIEIIEGDDSIRLSRASAIAPVMQAVPAPIAPLITEPVNNALPDVSAPQEPKGHGVQSPTVGTFYSRSGPDSDPFVQVGDKVNVGATLCVVEAMKTFNEIQSDKAGKIVKILKGDGDPVEFGEVLFEIA